MTPGPGAILETLEGDPEAAGRKWRRRYKVLNDKMTSDDVIQMAEVVRDLSHARQSRRISQALERMPSARRRTLVSESALGLDIDEKVDQALPRGEPGEE